MTFLKMEQVDLHDKRVIIRVDLNVPIKNGEIIDDTRIHAIVPTLKWVLAKNARILLLSHLGRPKEGVEEAAFSLKPVALRLEQLLNYPIRFEKEWLGGVDIGPQEIVLGENVRFNKGEEKNDPVLARQMAKLCDVFIMDAFGTAHRAQASTVGIAQFAPIAAAGLLLTSELDTLAKLLHSPKRPLVAIVSGAKISGKLELLKSLLNRVDVLIVGGGIANTFLAAQGLSVGDSLVEPNLITVAKSFIEYAEQQKVTLMIPSDGVLATEISDHATVDIRTLEAVSASEKILDIGPDSLHRYQEVIKKAGTILWNGPLGVFEHKPFEHGTKMMAKAIAASSAFSIVGGGETLAAIKKYNVAEQISYISTGGGAFLEYIEGKKLPGVDILKQ
jgi:phosphoglycerate kinase